MSPEPVEEVSGAYFTHDPGSNPRATVGHEKPDLDADLEGMPEEEDVDEADVEERLEESPEDAANRRDVPPTPENSIEARTEDGAEDEITRP